MKKLCSILILTFLIVNYSFMVTAAPIQFSDVKATDWFSSAVTRLQQNNIVAGYNGKYMPYNNVKVDEFIKMAVVTIDGVEQTIDSSYWATNYINRAKFLGLVAEGEFLDYSQPIKRQEMARIIQRSIEKIEGTTEPVSYDAFKANIKDINDAGDNFKDCLVKAFYSGILVGDLNYTTGETNVRPATNATRAETAVIIDRIKNFGERIYPSVPGITVYFNNMKLSTPASLISDEANIDMKILEKNLTGTYDVNRYCSFSFNNTTIDYDYLENINQRKLKINGSAVWTNPGIEEIYFPLLRTVKALGGSYTYDNGSKTIRITVSDESNRTINVTDPVAALKNPNIPDVVYTTQTNDGRDILTASLAHMPSQYESYKDALAMAQKINDTYFNFNYQTADKSTFTSKCLEFFPGTDVTYSNIDKQWNGMTNNRFIMISSIITDSPLYYQSDAGWTLRIVQTYKFLNASDSYLNKRGYVLNKEYRDIMEFSFAYAAWGPGISGFYCGSIKTIKEKI